LGATNAGFSLQPRSNVNRGFELDEDPATRSEAQRAYERALELDPQSVPAPINLGDLHYEEERSDEARACFERAIAQEPGDAKARYNLGTCCMTGRNTGRP